jgi:hypothetical protein
MITRKLIRLVVEWPASDPTAVTVESTSVVTDDEEGTQVGKMKTWRANAVVTAGTDLRDAVLAQSAQQDKPFTL